MTTNAEELLSTLYNRHAAALSVVAQDDNQRVHIDAARMALALMARELADKLAQHDNARLRTELAAAVDERNFADRRCAELEQQLLQLDADNAALIRSNNKTLHAIDWSTLSPEAQDYRIGLDAGRWKWRDIPRKVRLDLVRCVIRNTGEQPTQTQFDAIRPPWMATATSQCAAFGAQWSLLANLDREIEVAP